MESGNVTITGAADDGIQVELAGDASTGTTADHEDEDSGNFYMADGVLAISSYEGKAIKADGTITYSGGEQRFDTSDTVILASVDQLQAAATGDVSAVYDLNGRRMPSVKNLPKGLYVVKQNGKTTKVLVK